MKTPARHSIFVASFMLFLSFAGIATSSPRGGQAGPPPWAPAHGYRQEVRYIYFPQHNMYFDLHQNVYIYQVRGNWERRSGLPAGIRIAELRNTRKVELKINSPNPYRYNAIHSRYGKKPKGRR